MTSSPSGPTSRHFADEEVADTPNSIVRVVHARNKKKRTMSSTSVDSDQPSFGLLPDFTKGHSSPRVGLRQHSDPEFLKANSSPRVGFGIRQSSDPNSMKASSCPKPGLGSRQSSAEAGSK